MDQPNVVLIVADQLRADAIGAYGNDWVSTPNLDRLAATSTIVEWCYVTQPVCAPARGSILTGRYPQSHGVTRNGLDLGADIPTLAELLPESYFTGHVGKWHLGDDAVPQHGFDRWVSVEDWRRRYTRREYRTMEPDYHHFLRSHGFEPPAPDSSYEEWLPSANLRVELTQGAFIADRAVDFLDEAAQGSRPFCLVASFFEPHPPYTGPLDGMYDPDDVEVGPAFRVFPAEGSLADRLRAEYYLGGNLNPIAERSGDIHDTSTEAGWRRLRASYHANVSLLDRNVGRILDALEDGAFDDTVVVFTADHGDMLGDHGLLEKRCAYEEAVRVPLLIRDPRGAGPDRLAANVGQVDLVPTILDLVGAGVADGIDGRSRRAVLEGDEEQGDVFIQWNGGPDRGLGTEQIDVMSRVPWRTVITPDRWKLTLSPGDRCSLYDLGSDRFEMHNRYDESEQRDRVREMAARLRVWQEETGDTMVLPPV